MKVIEIRSEAEWQSLRSGWDTLLLDSASGSTFLTYEWASGLVAGVRPAGGVAHSGGIG